MMDITLQQGHTIWFALEKYKGSLQKDLDTKYGGHPRFGPEDEVFLNDEISRVEDVLATMKAQGYNPFR
jgi:hypothetical protein